MKPQRDTYTPQDMARMEPDDLHAFTGIPKLKLQRKADKVQTTHSYVGGPNKLTFTMACNDACLRACGNRDTRKCGDECFKFSNFKPKADHAT